MLRGKPLKWLEEVVKDHNDAGSVGCRSLRSWDYTRQAFRMLTSISTYAALEFPPPPAWLNALTAGAGVIRFGPHVLADRANKCWQFT